MRGSFSLFQLTVNTVTLLRILSPSQPFSALIFPTIESFMSPTEHLEHLLEILTIEKEEDQRIYREKVLSRKLKDRVKDGYSWYPVRMSRVYIGMGERWTIDIDAPEGMKTEGQVFQTGAVVSIFGLDQDREVGRLTGVITQLRSNRMRISLGIENLPDWLDRNKLGVDIEFDDKTYQEM